jgi:hypothetical protein
MKLVSIDVGLRNLAICILEGTSRRDVRIVGWDVIDVLGEKAGLSKPTCHKCGKAGGWHDFENSLFACTRHVPKQCKMPTKASLMKKTITELSEDVFGYNLSPKSRTKKDIADCIYNFLKTKTWARIEGTNKHAPVGDMACDIKAVLDKRSAWWKDATHCVIENQPDRRMFAVQHMLHMYFVCQGVGTCKGISAVHKLNNIITIDDSITTYRGRKKTGIVHASALVPPEWLPFMEKHKKKDDLADCFLQGLWALEHS